MYADRLKSRQKGLDGLMLREQEHDVGQRPATNPQHGTHRWDMVFLEVRGLRRIRRAQPCRLKPREPPPCLKDPGQTDQILEQPATPRARCGDCWPCFVVPGPAKLSLRISHSLGPKKGIYILCLFAIISVVARLCYVSFVDLVGMRHAVEFSAPTTVWLRQPGLQNVRVI